MTISELLALIEQETGLVLESNAQGQVLVSPESLPVLAPLLWSHPSLYFDQLSCLTAIDLGPEKAGMELVYTFYSLPHQQTLHLLLALPRPEVALPKVPSLSGIWKTADWHEREAYDLMGIEFEGHPDLRRILMPEDWEGHPLRKDYVEPDRYHGLNTKRE